MEIEITPVGDIQLVWGEEVNGLRAAVEFIPDKPEYSFGERIDLRFHIQSVSDKTIQFISESWRQDRSAIIEDRDGNMRAAPGTWYTGVCPIDRYYLKPGEKVVIDSYDLGIARNREQAYELKHPVGYRLHCEPASLIQTMPTPFASVPTPPYTLVTTPPWFTSSIPVPV